MRIKGTLAGCPVHARRKFHDALDNDRASAKSALAIFRDIYREERKIKETAKGDVERTRSLRNEKTWPLLERIKELVAPERDNVCSIKFFIPTYFIILSYIFWEVYPNGSNTNIIIRAIIFFMIVYFVLKILVLSLLILSTCCLSKGLEKKTSFLNLVCVCFNLRSLTSKLKSQSNLASIV